MVLIITMLYEYFNLNTVKEFQVLLSDANNSIQHYTFVCISLNDSQFYYVSLTIQLYINQLFMHS